MEETKRQSPMKMLLDVSLNAMNDKHSGKITSDLHSLLTYIVFYNSSTMKFSFFNFSNAKMFAFRQPTRKHYKKIGNIQIMMVNVAIDQV